MKTIIFTTENGYAAVMFSIKPDEGSIKPLPPMESYYKKGLVVHPCPFPGESRKWAISQKDSGQMITIGPHTPKQANRMIDCLLRVANWECQAAQDWRESRDYWDAIMAAIALYERGWMPAEPGEQANG